MEKIEIITVKSWHLRVVVIFCLQSHYLAAMYMSVSISCTKQSYSMPLYSDGIKVPLKNKKS